MSDPLTPLSEGDPEALAILVDFDGSLAPIVDDPTTAAALPEARDALGALVGQVGLVAVVSGRPVAFLLERLGLDGVRYVGQYGLEWIDETGAIAHDPRATQYLDAVAAVADEAEVRFPGLLVERKGRLAVTLHWRTSPERGDDVGAWADAAAERLGLAAHEARMAREVRPPIAVDKGTAVTALLRGAVGIERAAFAGDDRGDLAAFDALVRLRDHGSLHDVVRVAVRSTEAPAELLDAAELVVDGPDGLAALLRALAGWLS